MNLNGGQLSIAVVKLRNTMRKLMRSEKKLEPWSTDYSRNYSRRWSRMIVKKTLTPFFPLNSLAMSYHFLKYSTVYTKARRVNFVIYALYFTFFNRKYSATFHYNWKYLNTMVFEYPILILFINTYELYVDSSFSHNSRKDCSTSYPSAPCSPDNGHCFCISFSIWKSFHFINLHLYSQTFLTPPRNFSRTIEEYFKV